MPLLAASLLLGEVLRPRSSLLNGMELRLPSPVGIFERAAVWCSVPIRSSRARAEQPAGRGPAIDVAMPPSAGNSIRRRMSTITSSPPRKDEPITVSVHAQRIGSPADPDMEVLKPPKGDILASPQDDGENIGQLRFATFSRDIRYELTPPEDGDYKLRLEHLYGQLQGGPQYVYRLEIARRTPDFQFVCTPPHETRIDSHVLYRGGHERVDVLVWRLGNHKAPITVAARTLPPGVTAKPFVINAEGKWGTLVLESAADAPIGEAEIEIVGVSDGETGPIERRARGGVMTWDTVNTPGIARMTRTIMLAVRDSAPFTVSATPAEFHLQAGQPLELTLHVERRADMPSEVQFGAAGLPQIKGLDVPLTKVLVGETQKNLKLDTAKIAPGMYSFILNGEAQVPFEEKPGSKRNIRCLYPTNAITFEILPKEAAK